MGLRIQQGSEGLPVPSLQLLLVRGRVTLISLNCPVLVRKPRIRKVMSVVQGNAIGRF